MTKLSTIPQHELSITCGLCKHHTMLEVANLIAIVGGDTTAHEVRQRARCHNCGDALDASHYQILTSKRVDSFAHSEGNTAVYNTTLCTVSF